MEQDAIIHADGFTAALAALAPYLANAEAAVLTAGALFTRVSAIVFLLPGFGEQLISTRVKLAVALAFAAIAWPLVSAPEVGVAPAWTATGAQIGVVYVAEAVNGALIGVLIRLFIFALQTAGALAAQSLSISQMFGAGVAPDPEPIIATLLMLGGITLALALGLHIKVAELIIFSYQPLPLGQFPISSDAALLTTRRVGETFNLALSLAMPFVIVSFVYNISLGFINKAMPQIMVSFVGLPFITWVGILLLMLTSTAVLTAWHDAFDATLPTLLSF